MSLFSVVATETKAMRQREIKEPIAFGWNRDIKSPSVPFKSLEMKV